MRYFCHESQEGGITPPLLQLESTIKRYPNAWENGLVVRCYMEFVCHMRRILIIIMLLLI